MIETKSYGKNLNNYLDQLKGYCDEKRAIIAIITNGEEIRFYSPFWRKIIFAETLIYSIKRKNLSDHNVVKNIESIFLKEHFENNNIIDSLQNREREIDEGIEQINSFKKAIHDKRLSIENDNKILKDRIKEIEEEITNKEKELAKFEVLKKEEIKKLKEELLISDYSPTIPPRFPSNQEEIIYTKSSSGRKGHEQLIDYLIPTIRLIKNGHKHSDAFRLISEKLEVRYQTVNAQCTRQLGISTGEFVKNVENGNIVGILKNKFPGKIGLIDKELEN